VRPQHAVRGAFDLVMLGAAWKGRPVASIGRMLSAVPWAMSAGLPLARTASTSAVKSSIQLGTTA
jgi:hypothetical protein